MPYIYPSLCPLEYIFNLYLLDKNNECLCESTLHVFESVGILLCIRLIHWHTLLVAGHLPFQVVLTTLTPANVHTL